MKFTALLAFLLLCSGCTSKTYDCTEQSEAMGVWLLECITKMDYYTNGVSYCSSMAVQTFCKVEVNDQ